MHEAKAGGGIQPEVELLGEAGGEVTKRHGDNVAATPRAGQVQFSAAAGSQSACRGGRREKCGRPRGPGMSTDGQSTVPCSRGWRTGGRPCPERGDTADDAILPPAPIPGCARMRDAMFPARAFDCRLAAKEEGPLAG